MRIASTGREYVKWPIPDTTPNDPLEVTFDGGTTWHPLDRPDPGTARALISGPDATDNPPGTITVPAGTHHPHVRLNSTPETIIRAAGLIYITPNL